MTTDYDRELLAVTSSRHLHALPVAVSNAISAAVDELTDPLVLPLLFGIDQEQTRDLPGVLTAVRARLLTACQTAAVGQSLAYARAARELSAALYALPTPAGGEIRRRRGPRRPGRARADCRGPANRDPARCRATGGAGRS